MLKSLLAVAALVFPVSSFALGPIQPLDRVIVKTEQFKGVSYKLEQGLGRPLTANEKAELSRQLPNGPIDTDEDKLIIKAAYGEDLFGNKQTDALYCVGISGAIAGRLSGAVCVSGQTMNVYALGLIGLGTWLEASANVWRLTIDFNPALYPNGRDPIPGSYVTVAGGITLAVGGTAYGALGDNGKVLSGGSFNLGFQINPGELSGIFIK